MTVLSIASWISSPLHATYAATKSAAWSLTNGLRHELRAQGTQVLGLHVGFFDTDLTRGMDVPTARSRRVAADTMAAQPPVPGVRRARPAAMNQHSDLPTTARPLAVEPLTAEAFRPFGEVIATSEATAQYPINAGYAERFHDLARLDTQADGGHPVLSLFRAKPRSLPMRIELLERHLLGSQAFVPLMAQRCLVVVAPPGPVPDIASLRCFLVAPGQGVNYARGTWHHPLIALDAGGDFLVIDRGGPGSAGDCEEFCLAEPRLVESAAAAVVDDRRVDLDLVPGPRIDE